MNVGIAIQGVTNNSASPSDLHIGTVTAHDIVFFRNSVQVGDWNASRLNLVGAITLGGGITSGVNGATGGSLALNGSVSGTANLTVNSGATLVSLDKALSLGANALTAGDTNITGVLNSIGGGNGVNSNLLKNNGNSSPYGPEISFAAAAPNNTTQYFLNLKDTSASRALVYSNGTFGSATNTYGAIISMREYKQDIVPAGSQLSDVEAASKAMSKFRFKKDPSGPLQLGWIVDELEPICPGLILESPETESVECVDKDGKTVTEIRETGKTLKGIKTSVALMKGFKATGELIEWSRKIDKQIAQIADKLCIVLE